MVKEVKNPSKGNLKLKPKSIIKNNTDRKSQEANNKNFKKIKKELILEGLACAHCASKIEKRCQK